MCRHLSGVGNVTYQESDTPRGRALLIDKARMNPERLGSDGLLESVYKADLSAACRFHCVSHFDENGLLLAARRDLAEAGLAPEKVGKLAEDIMNNADFKLSGSGKVLLYVDRDSEQLPEIGKAFAAVARAAGVAYQTISGGDTGKALLTLGFREQALALAEKFLAKAKSSGADTLVVSDPAAYDALMYDFPAPGMKILHSSEFIVNLIDKGGLRPARAAGKLYYLESDFLKNYNGGCRAPHALLEALGAELQAFGTNGEESYSAGEGAVVFDLLNPGLAAAMAARVASKADNPSGDTLVTASPYTRRMLSAAGLKVLTLEELAASLLEVQR